MKPFDIEYRLVSMAYDAAWAKEGPRSIRREAGMTAIKYATAQAKTARMYSVYAAGRKILTLLGETGSIAALYTSYQERAGSEYMHPATHTSDQAPAGAAAPIRTPTVIRGTLPERSEAPDQLAMCPDWGHYLEEYI